jgi:hypothetical protein
MAEQIVFLTRTDAPDALAGARIVIADADTPAGAALFAAGPELLAFVRWGSDPAGVDVAAASAAGVLVVLTERAGTEAVVEAVLAGRVPPGAVNAAAAHRLAGLAPPPPPEIGGKDGPEPTRYGDWQHKGRVSDF